MQTPISSNKAASVTDGTSTHDYVTFHDRVTVKSTELKQADQTKIKSNSTITCLSKLSQCVNDLKAAAAATSAIFSSVVWAQH